jgi:hypothetical protein
VHEGDKALDRLRLALEDRFDRPGARVPDPPGDVVLLCEAPDRIPEEHALDAA